MAPLIGVVVILHQLSHVFQGFYRESHYFTPSLNDRSKKNTSGADATVGTQRRQGMKLENNWVTERLHKSLPVGASCAQSAKKTWEFGAFLVPLFWKCVFSCFSYRCLWVFVFFA